MNKSVGFLLLCLFFCLLVPEVAFGQSQSVGVSVGDKFTYVCTLTGTHNESLSWDPWMPENNQSTWQIIITDINATKITYQLQIFLANGTDETFPSQFLDVYSGGSNGLNYVFFVAANLNVNDMVYPGGPTYFVNDSVTRDYASGLRSINHISFNTALDFRNAYCDKLTGVMVEFTATYLDLTGTFSLNLIYSSIWTVSTSPTPTLTGTITPANSITATPTSSVTPITTTSQPSPTIPEFPSLAILSAIALMGLCTIAYLKTKKIKLNTQMK